MPLRLGLRFERGDERRLNELAAQVRAGEMGQQAAGTFEQAALAARTGEPLEVFCDNPIEVVQMAALYTVFGVTQPVIEELSQG